MKKLIPADAVLVPGEAERVFSGQIFDVYQWEQEMFDGSKHTFEMLKRTDTVSVIAVVDNKIMVIDDEQPHLGSRKSFPGGRVDDTDDSIEAAARREVQEETGYSFNNWRLIKVWQPYRKIEWFVNVLLAWDVAGQQEPKLDPGEKITVENVDIAKLKQLVLNRTGYLAESEDIFAGIDNIDQLLALQAYEGAEVDR